MKEQLQEVSRRFEQDDQFPVGLRDGIGNSTLTTTLTELQTDHTLGNDKSIGAISRFIGCFEPITDSSSNHPGSLWDQTATAVMAYRHLSHEDQEQVNGMMDTLLWSLANTPQERKVNGHTKDISPHARKLATMIGLTTDTWEHITEPKHYVKQRKLRMHPKIATASALAAVSVIAACSPVRSTITPEATIPAITQPAQITEVPATPTKTPEPINIPTHTPTELPLPSEFLSQIPADKLYEITNGQVLVDGQVWFEINSVGEWQDKRPLYWQCGSKIYSIEEEAVEEEAKILPTGLISKREFGTYTYLKGITARACLTKLNDVSDPLFPDLAVRSKVVFFDLDGKAHEYTIMMGAVDNSGREHGLSIGTFTPEGIFYRGMSIKEALPILEKYYNINASKQVDIDFATEDGGAPWILGKYINQNRELTVQLIEALKTGRGFPEDVPEGFFLWIIQVQFMPGFVP